MLTLHGQINELTLGIDRLRAENAALKAELAEAKRLQCDCTTATHADGRQETYCGSDQMMRSITAPQPAAVPDGWKPIETVPKDGSIILICRGEEVVAGWYDRANDKGYGWTHWMPLPAAPDAPQASQDAKDGELLQVVRSVIANDSIAISYQSFGQYRTMLLKIIDAAMKEAE